MSNLRRLLMTQKGGKVYPSDKYCYTDIDGVYHETDTNTFVSGKAKIVHRVPDGLTTFHSLFYTGSTTSYNINLTTVERGSFRDTSNVTNIASMFRNCTSLQSIDLSNLDAHNLTYIQAMFYNCTSLQSLDLSNLDAHNVTDIKGMFYNCTSLQSLDLSNLDTHNVTDMTNFFYNCKKLENLNFFDCEISVALGYSPLTPESILNVLQHLSDSATGQTITFKSKLITKGEYQEIDALVAQKSNWSIVGLY